MKNLLICILFFSCHSKPVLKSVPEKFEGVTVTVDMKDTLNPTMKVVSNSPNIIILPGVTVSHDTAEINKLWRQADSMDNAEKTSMIITSNDPRLTVGKVLTDSESRVFEEKIRVQRINDSLKK